VNDFSTRYAALAVGLVVGLALGLVYTWVISPVELVNTTPMLLRTDYRLSWVRLAALSYVADGDLERARLRLDGLEREDVANAIQALIEEYAAAGRPADELRGLTTLAEAFDVHTPAMLVYLYAPTASPPASVGASSRTATPTPTARLSSPLPHMSTPDASPSPIIPTPRPTLTPTPGPDAGTPLFAPTAEPESTPPAPTPTPPLLARLRLVEQELICQPEQTPHIEVEVRDEDGAGLTGVEVWLMWPGGADRAVTGLKPQKGAGYVDFITEQGSPGSVSYALGVGELGIPLVSGLQVEPCPEQEGEETVLGSWRIVLGPRSPET
jgi:hypothetical protein